MTLAQLQSRLARFLGLQNIGDDPAYLTWSTDALNDAQIEVAAELQVPRRLTTIVASSGPFPAPSDIQTWGIIAATDTTNGNPLAIVDPQTRLAKYPSNTIGTPELIEYYQVSNTLQLYPAPPAPVNVEIYYARIPTPMVAPTDEPFDGMYREYHIIVALKAALLVHEADWGDPSRVQWVYQRYEIEKRRFAERVNKERHTKPLGEGEISGFTGTA